MSWSSPRTWSVGEILTAANMNTFVSSNLAALAPTGAYIHMFGTSSATINIINGGWLECNGVAVSRTTYATLFALISTSFGAGDGSTTFNLPDFRGRVPVGVGGSHSVGATDGQATATNRRPEHRTTNGLGLSVSSVLFEVGNGGRNITQSTNVADNTSGGGRLTRSGSTSESDAIQINTTASLTGTIGTNNGNDVLDAPSYIVAGIWVIKY